MKSIKEKKKKQEGHLNSDDQNINRKLVRNFDIVNHLYTFEHLNKKRK
jgi:hypothetical protein